MYIRDYNKATTLYDTDAFIVDGSQETMYILVSDLYQALIGNKGFITETELNNRNYQTKDQVDNNIEARGYVTALQADKLITDKGYQTGPQVQTIVESYGYQNSSDVNRIIEAKGYQTKDQVDSNIDGRGYLTEVALDPYVTETELEAKDFQNETEVVELIKNNATKVDVDSAFSTTSENPLQNKVITDYLNKNILYLGVLYRLDSSLDSVGSDYNVPDLKTYIFTQVPSTGESYLQNGGSHTVIGMEYQNHKYGFQMSVGSAGIKCRSLIENVWGNWRNFLTNGYLDPVLLTGDINSTAYPVTNNSTNSVTVEVSLNESLNNFKTLLVYNIRKYMTNLNTTRYIVDTYYIDLDIYNKEIILPVSGLSHLQIKIDTINKKIFAIGSTPTANYFGYEIYGIRR